MSKENIEKCDDRCIFRVDGSGSDYCGRIYPMALKPCASVCLFGDKVGEKSGGRFNDIEERNKQAIKYWGAINKKRGGSNE